MVPMWTIPIALTCGNCVILKPSEKVPITMSRVALLLQEAGIPPGVFQIVNGTIPVVETLCDSPSVDAVTFVGSTNVARKVASRCQASSNPHKRVLALGGAKNHLIAAPDCNIDMASSDIVASYSGCAGQRCMAASALLVIDPAAGSSSKLIDQIVAKSSSLRPGQGAGQIGPVIDAISRDRILSYIDEAERTPGATILVDGRGWAKKQSSGHAEDDAILSRGFWVGPTVILHTNQSDRALHDEIFGPVLSILCVPSKEDALTIQQACPYGNASCIYTSSGAMAEWFCKRFTTGMIGVNIGVPVPREPFSFGGTQDSKFGNSDITGDGALEFFTVRRKVTTKWGPPQELSWLS